MPLGDDLVFANPTPKGVIAGMEVTLGAPRTRDPEIASAWTRVLNLHRAGDDL